MNQEQTPNMRQTPLSEDAELRIAAMELALSYHANKDSRFPASDYEITRTAKDFYKFLAGK